MVRLLALVLAVALGACSSPRPAGFAEPEQNQSIIACGQPIPIGTRVVLWDEPGGYNAYRDVLHFGPPSNGANTPPDGKLRYEAGRRTKGDDPRQLVEPGSTDLEALRRAVDLFVVHYDVCGTSERCFLVLHDRRCLSVHFLLDVDGTIYQTLDLRERAWHAGRHNTRSVGVEIANIGSRPITDAKGLAEIDAWYERDERGLRLDPPDWVNMDSVATPGFVGYSAQAERIQGWIQGHERAQYDFTPEQYRSLVLLAAGLCRALPRIEADAPRDAHGKVLDRVMDPAGLAGFQGIVGHHHISAVKQDPGPAFAWESFLRDVRAEL